MSRSSCSNGERNTVSGNDWIWHPTRCAIYIRDGRRCLACGARRKVLSLDHVVPRRNGGGNDPSNLVTLCIACNGARWHRSVEAWRPELVEVFAAAVSKPLDRAAGRRLSAKLRPRRLEGARERKARGPIAIAGVPF